MKPLLRFAEFNGEWEEKRLGEVCSLKNGFAFKSKSFDKNGKYKVITISNVKNGYLDLNKVKTISSLPRNIKKHQILNTDDIIVSMTGNVGRICIVNKKNCLLNQRVGKLAIKNSKIYYKFLFHSINRPLFEKQMTILAQGGAQPNISKKDIENFKIHLPPTLAEQEKIAKFLSAVDEKIEIIAKKIEKLKEYKKGLLQKLLSVKNSTPELRFPGFSGDWKQKRLGEIGICKDNKRIPLNEEQRKKRKGIYPYWGSTKIMDYVDDYIFDGEYVLISEDGGYFYDYKEKPIAFYINGKFWANNHIHILKIKKEYNAKFIYYSLAHKNILAYIIGGTRTKLNQKDMLQIKIHIPPTLAEQQKIADFLSAIDEKIELNEQKLNKLKEYKKGLLQKMLI